MSRQGPGVVAKNILSYFLRNPQAADTLEGVVRWRLPEQTIYRTVEETNHALHWLVKQGFLQRVLRLGSGALFRLNQEERDRAESFLGRAGKIWAKDSE